MQAADDAGVRPRLRLLRAELIWAMYEQARSDRASSLRSRGVSWLDAIVCDAWRVVELPRPDAPPPFVRLEPGLSPLVWRRERDLPLVRGAHPQDGLTLHQLPFPVVLFPPDWLDQPERLAVVLHEVGHALDGELKISPAWADALAPDDPRTWLWPSWLPEITADLVMVALGGPGAVTVLDDMLGQELGYAGLTPIDTPHPPGVLRAILAHEVSTVLYGWAPALSRAREAEVRQLARGEERAARDLINLLLGPTSPPAPSRMLRTLSTAAPPWCRAATAPSRASIIETLDRLSSGVLPQQVDADVTAFVQKWRPSITATFGVDPQTLYKTPPLALAVRHDRLAFVGETNHNLLRMLQEAHKLRERRWTQIEVFFLNRTAIRGMATPERPFADRWKERQAAVTALREALDTLAIAWSLHEHDHATLFASFWGPADPAAPDLKCPWLHIHTSARVWGRDIRRSPSVDWHWSPDMPNPQMEELAAGLEALRSDADRL